ncbi:MAG: hypothetical protein DRI90_02750 [Deltaproteobacteria bacterium]|nr:MAG: hypothetical protein DRI90_02750 [Deltaproteobacteria bacterium]
MKLSSTPQLVAIAATAAALVGACTTLLGNDFVIETAAPGGGDIGGSGGSTSTSSGGGVGGNDGGGGVGPGLPYQCAWQLPIHVRVASLQDSPNDDWRSGLQIEVAEQDARVVAQREVSGATSSADLYTLDGNNTAVSSWPAYEVHDAARLGANKVAVLYSMRNLNPPSIELWMRVIDDTDGNGADASSVQLTSSSAFADMGANASNFNARFAIHQGTANVDFFASYADTNGAFVETYGRHLGSGPVTPVKINQANDLTEKDVRPFAMVTRDDRSYLFLGDPSATAGPRQYVLDDTITGPIAARTIGEPSMLVLDVLMKPNSVNVAAAEIGQDVGDPLFLFADSIEPAALSSFAIGDLSIAAEYASVANLPVGDTFMGWIADIFVMMGSTAMNSDHLTFAFFDALGHERGTGSLPFAGQLNSGEERIAIDRVAVAARDEFFHTLGGNLHVAWTEDHHVGNPSESFKVMYYDQLGCYPTE